MHSSSDMKPAEHRIICAAEDESGCVVCGGHSAVIRRFVARSNGMAEQQYEEIRQLHEGCRKK
jgi:hypothetical protein